MRSLEFNDKIAPFTWIKHDDGSSSVTLYASKKYKKELFQTRRREGFSGSGYDWESLAQTLIQEIAPEFRESISFDSEKGMFCAYSHNSNELQRFAVLLKETCENDTLIAELFSHAKPDEFVVNGTFLDMQEKLGSLFDLPFLNNIPSEEELKDVVDKIDEDIGTALGKTLED